jgi:GNAT superfamily N-acetyltransferase
MTTTPQRIAALERVNYAATLPIAQVTPGLDIVLRDDVIITSSEAFPAPDTTHACLLQATSQTADALIAEVTGYFRSKGLPPTVFVSPACTPPDLPARLEDQGFVQQETLEAWMVLNHLQDVEIPPLFPKVAVRRIAPEDALTFAQIFMAAFDMPVDLAPYMAQLLAPSIGLPGAYHTIALLDGQPVGTFSLLCYERFGIIGSAGVLPAHRRSGAAHNLAIQAAAEARARGIDTLIAQTAAGTPLERLVRISGFKRAFARTCYALP